jgi:4-amino-4-deoxy-L-arabinose transferase-like glycosyltransferase
MGLVAVYPRTFAFFRAEPLLAFLATLGLLLALRLWEGERSPARRAAALGLVLGLMMLARQQGVFVLATVGVLALARAAAEPGRRAERLRALAITALVTALVAAPSTSPSGRVSARPWPSTRSRKAPPSRTGRPGS